MATKRADTTCRASRIRASAADPLGLTPDYNTAFPRETVDSGEVGIKTTLFDKTLRLNAAVFDQQYTDFQLNTFTGIQFVVTSLPKVVSKGVDFDFAWAAPIAGLSFAGGVTKDLTDITNFGYCGADSSAARGMPIVTYRATTTVSRSPRSGPERCRPPTWCPCRRRWLFASAPRKSTTPHTTQDRISIRERSRAPSDC